MSNEEKKFSTALSRINDSFMPMIVDQFDGNGLQMEPYSKQCVLSALSAINAVLSAKNINWNDPQLDKSNVTQVLMDVACLKLNASAHPREVYFTTRNVKTGLKDDQNKDIWKKQIEMGIEGDGNDAILANFGRGVDKVHQFWLVRENDPWEYPKFNGLEMTPPQWTQTGKGKVVRVVYPIVKTDGLIDFYIGERDDVAKNLMAHITNNMMNETFGLAESKFKANDKQKKEIAAKKAEILKRANDMGLDALDDPDLQAWISPAWTEYHSREQMIIRKMRNNVVKKIPKDFGNAYVEMTYDKNTDPTYAAIAEEIEENANTVTIDVEHRVVPQEEPETPTVNQEPEKELQPEQVPPAQSQSGSYPTPPPPPAQNNGPDWADD